MKTRKNVRVVTAALTGVVLLAGGGWVAAGQIKSPAQIAADTAPPKASLVTAQVQRGSLSTEVIVRGTGRYGEPQLISLPSSSLKTSTQLVSQIAKRDDVLHERSIAMTVSGRPVFVLQGATPMHRDIGPGDSGQDVRQLEQALVRFGYVPGRVDGNYDSKTAAAVARMYRAGGAAPFGLTEAQIDKLNTAAALVATTNDYMIQQRLALRTAQRGATPAEVNQARIDAAAVAELIPPARSAISAARARIAEAQDLEAIARRQQAEGDGTLRRDVAAAQVDIATKQGAVDDAVTAQFEAQRAVDALPPDATPAEVEAARSNLRIAAAKLPSANAELSAARAVVAAAENALRQSSVKARDDGRKAARDLALARSDLREGKRTVRVLTHKRRIAVSRVQILATPLSSGVERQAVSAATSEVNRAKADLARLASRSGVQVPADEILFFPNTPVRVDSVTAKPGTQVAGDLMTVSNTTLAIDSGLSPQDAKLVKTGQRVHIEDSETGIDLQGHVTLIADRPGTNTQLADPTKTAFEVTPVGGNKRLVDTSVRLTIAIKSTKGKVLTVPYSAVSVRADGRARVRVDIGGGRTRLVIVNTGLAAEGNVEVSSARRGALREGDRVIIGEGSSFAATKAPTGSEAPATPAAVSPSSSSGAGAGSGAGATPGTTAPAAPPAARRRRRPPAARRAPPARREGPVGPEAEPMAAPRGPHLAIDDASVVELHDVSRTYGTDPPVHALRGVDLLVERGDAIAIVGPSGSGKSTLLNIIGCLDRPTGGRYLIDGNDTATLGEDELSVLRGRLVGFVFQTFNLLAHRTVLENVMLSEVYLGRPREGRRQRALEALERVGLEQRAEFLPVKLSGGQQQRVAIARALSGSPSLLLCDEPTGNLDSVNTAAVLALFQELVDDGMTMLLITHDDHVAARMPRRTSITDGQLTEHT